MTNDQNKVVRNVLSTVASALRLGVTKNQIIQAIQGISGGADAKTMRGAAAGASNDEKDRDNHIVRTATPRIDRKSRND
jgi:NH3-dependent NAD+ synthetase